MRQEIFCRMIFVTEVFLWTVDVYKRQFYG